MTVTSQPCRAEPVDRRLRAPRSTTARRWRGFHAAGRLSAMNCADPIHPGAPLRPGVGVEKLRPQRLDGDPAADGGEPLNTLEKQLLRRGRQVRHQSLRRPRAGQRGVKARLLQRRRPVVAQVHRHGDPVACGLGAVLGQRRGFEVQHPGLVELVDRRPIRPRQSPRPRVQSRRQDHHLPNARSRRVEEKRIEKRGPRGHIADHRLHLQRQIGLGFQ